MYQQLKRDNYIAGFHDHERRWVPGHFRWKKWNWILVPAKGKDFSTVIRPYAGNPRWTGAPYYSRPARPYRQKLHLENDLPHQWRASQWRQYGRYGLDLCRDHRTLCLWRQHPDARRCYWSGTVGTGCFLELNGTGKLNNPDYQEQWLKPGDKVEMTIDGLAHLHKYHRGRRFNLLHSATEKIKRHYMQIIPGQVRNGTTA